MGITWGAIGYGQQRQFPTQYGQAEYAGAFDGPYSPASIGYFDTSFLSQQGVWGPYDAGEATQTYYLRQLVPWGGKGRLAGSNTCEVSRPVGSGPDVGTWLLRVEAKVPVSEEVGLATPTIDAAWFAGAALSPHVALANAFDVPIALIDGSDAAVVRRIYYELIVQATYVGVGNVPYPDGRGVGWTFTIGLQSGTLPCGRSRGGWHAG